MTHSELFDIKNSSRGFSEMISCYENFIEKMKVHTEFSSIPEAINHYESL